MPHNQRTYTVMYWNAVHTGQRWFETLHDMQAFLAKVQSAGYKVQHTPVPELDVEPVHYQAIIREALQELAEMRGDI
jgi:hypothetical protein